MKEYQPFAISNFRGSFNESVEPWLLPRDAFQLMKNAHMYRGVIEKIQGVDLFAIFTNRTQKELTGTINGTNKTFTTTLGTTPTSTNFYAQSSINTNMTSIETWTFNNYASSTVINLLSNLGGTGTVNLSTGAVSLVFNTAPVSNVVDGVQYNTVLFEWDSAPAAGPYSIMGIKQYYVSDGTQEVMVFDERRVGIITPVYSMMIESNNGAPNVVSEIPHAFYASDIVTGDGMTVTFTGTLSTNVIPGTVVITQYTSDGLPLNPPSIITDNGDGQLKGGGLTVDTSFINYSTGAYTLTFTVAPASGNYFDAVVGVYGDLFTGNINNFFTLSNYQGIAVFTNFVDPPMYYNGTMINYLPILFTNHPVISNGGIPAYDIIRVLHVQAYRDVMVLLNVVLSNGTRQNNYAYWSQFFNPLEYANVNSANPLGNFLPAPTSESIRTFGLITTDMVVRFNNSERILRFTGDAFSAFRWDNTNNLWACDGPYSDINYDSYFTSVGKPAIVGSDGVNVRRVDELIPDFTDGDRIVFQTPVPYMDQTNIAMGYGERFDDIKEGWLCYVSTMGNFPSPSDNILAFNYLDETYSIYTFSFSCLGFGVVINQPTWGTIFTPWDEYEVAWGSYSQEQFSLVDLAGDHDDQVFQLNSGTTLQDMTTPVLFDIISKNFNPFIEDGQLCRFGFLDLFFTSDVNTTVRVQFFKDDQLYIDGAGNPAGYYQETILDLTPTSGTNSLGSSKIWKRIYVGSVAQSHTFRIYQNIEDFPTDDPTASLEQNIRIHSQVPYFKPAGRIFQ